MRTTRQKRKSVLATNIVKRRNLLGWSAEELAEKAGIPYPTLRNIEADASAGRPKTRAAIARALGCQESDLFVDEEHLREIQRKIWEKVNPEATNGRHGLSDDVINHPTAADAAKILVDLLSASPVRRAYILGILYHDRAFVDALGGDPAPGLQSVLKAL